MAHTQQISGPKVSVCLPNLNTRPYLEERLHSIFAQTLEDWELIVYDNYSDDGAWELFQDAAQREPRMRIAQAPRNGLYANWNNCFREATGQYVYIATSDDTMAPDCLKKMVAALEAHPTCGLAHCRLRRTNPDGSDETPNWWDTHSTFARSSGPLLDQYHIRKAPFDGLLHLLGQIVYVSLTQLLIRRSLFDKIGLFETQWGSTGDFNWDMRASLTTSTIHVPDTWASWRLHADQATAQAGIGDQQHAERVEAMIRDALDRCDHALPPAVRDRLTSGGDARWAEARRFERRRRLAGARRGWMFPELLRGSWLARRQMRARLTGGPRLPEALPRIMRDWVEDITGEPALVPLDPPDDAHHDAHRDHTTDTATTAA